MDSLVYLDDLIIIMQSVKRQNHNSAEQPDGASSSSSSFSSPVATTAPQDNRVIFSEDQRMRRYDSIARLFAMDSRYSACAAVSIVDDQLIIASNSALAKVSQQVASLLNGRLKIIRNFLRSAREEKSSFTEGSPEILSVIHRLKAQGGLLKEIGNGKTDDIQRLIQASYKLSYTVQGLDDEPFSSEEIHALLDSDKVTYLVPTEREGEERYESFMALYHLNETDIVQVPDEEIGFDARDSTHSVNQFHAEQLIAYYITLTFSSVDTARLPIGISMLSCAMCQRLNSPQFQIRGTSRMLYNGTASLVANSMFSAGSFHSPTQDKKGLLHAQPSPFDSRGKKRAKLDFSGMLTREAAEEEDLWLAERDGRLKAEAFSPR